MARIGRVVLATVSGCLIGAAVGALIGILDCVRGALGFFEPVPHGRWVVAVVWYALAAATVSALPSFLVGAIAREPVSRLRSVVAPVLVALAAHLHSPNSRSSDRRSPSTGASRRR